MIDVRYKGKLKICILDNREALGEKAAKDAAEIIKELLSKNNEINVAFAAAPSQDETLRYLLKDDDIEWERINAFQLDEYCKFGLDKKGSFANYLNIHIFSKVTFNKIYYICCEDDYASIVKNHPFDVVFLGIGENGHIAFNDPSFAKFDEKEILKKVKLDERSRLQQVNDGCFPSLDDVPTEAKTLTIPPIMASKYIICSVPGIRKAEAVKEALYGPISEKCPASIMRRHMHGNIYLDKESASLLEDELGEN